ncbi:MAG: ferritin-like domain-containing protein [Stenotrophobium sp.]
MADSPDNSIHAALIESTPERKCALVAALDDSADMSSGDDDSRIPGRPAQPLLIHPSQVQRRGLGTPEGRAALIHAVAHIEFNAINLALDACWRFRGMPADYYRDWLSVAKDEARHFLMLQQRLQELGCAYGDFSAHNGLWEAAEKTRHDVLVRMALVPRVLEARGLDVTPGMILRLQRAGDPETVRILEIILQDEVRHVAIGTHWFHTLCAQRALEPTASFRTLLVEYGMRLRPPFNHEARRIAGFVGAEFEPLDITAG